MCDTERLIAYLYDELGDGDRARMDAHLRGCGACRNELSSLRGVRADLTAWAPPEPDLGFQIVRQHAAPARPMPLGWRARLTPALGLAAAATLVIAAAAAIANVQVHYGSDGFTVRTGWTSQPAAAIAQNTAPIQAARAAAIDPAAVQAIERRIADLEQFEKSTQSASAQRPSVVSASANRLSDAELVKRFRELVAESENHEQSLLARQIQQVTIDTQRQRATDMAHVTQMVNYIDSRTASDAQQHLQLANMIRVANQK
jgi:anti-sigma factor RsiW